MNFWVKTYIGDKITRDTVIRNDLAINVDNILDTAQQVCHSLDIATPIITKYHIENLEKFNFMKFVPYDFIESVDFDYLIFEYFVNAPKKKKP